MNSDYIASWWCICPWQRGWWQTWIVSWNWSISSSSRCHSRSRVHQPWCLAAALVLPSHVQAVLAPWMPSAAHPLPRLTTLVMFYNFFLNLILKISTIWGEWVLMELWYICCWNTESSFCLKTDSEPLLTVSLYSAFVYLIILLLKENLPMFLLRVLFAQSNECLVKFDWKSEYL